MLKESRCKVIADVRKIKIGPVVSVPEENFKPEPHNNFIREIRVRDGEGAEFILSLFGQTEGDLIFFWGNHP